MLLPIPTSGKSLGVFQNVVIINHLDFSFSIGTFNVVNKDLTVLPIGPNHEQDSSLASSISKDTRNPTPYPDNGTTTVTSTTTLLSTIQPTFTYEHRLSAPTRSVQKQFCIPKPLDNNSRLWPLKDKTEAFLLNYFVTTLSSWVWHPSLPSRTQSVACPTSQSVY